MKFNKKDSLDEQSFMDGYRSKLINTDMEKNQLEAYRSGQELDKLKKIFFNGHYHTLELLLSYNPDSDENGITKEKIDDSFSRTLKQYDDLKNKIEDYPQIKEELSTVISQADKFFTSLKESYNMTIKE